MFEFCRAKLSDPRRQLPNKRTLSHHHLTCPLSYRCPGHHSSLPQPEHCRRAPEVVPLNFNHFYCFVARLHCAIVVVVFVVAVAAVVVVCQC